MSDKQILDFFNNISFPWVSSHSIICFIGFCLLVAALLIYLIDHKK